MITDFLKGIFRLICSILFNTALKIQNIYSRFRKHSWKYDLLIAVIGGFIASGITSCASWRFIKWINPNKVILCLRYAYEYDYEKATQSDPIREILKDVAENLR